jgi:hypothetical protein
MVMKVLETIRRRIVGIAAYSNSTMT